MDSKGFDSLTKKLADGASRRGALRALAGGAAATALGVFGLGKVAEVGAAGEQCRAAREFCNGDRDCCSEICREGACVCRRRGRNCVFDGRPRDKACCSGRCRQRTGTCA